MCARVVDIPQIVIDDPFGGRSLPPVRIHELEREPPRLKYFSSGVADLSPDFRNKD
jgi:hypothetical protein